MDKTVRTDRGKHATGKVRVICSGGVPGAAAVQTKKQRQNEVVGPGSAVPAPSCGDKYDSTDMWVKLLEDFPRWAKKYLRIDTRGEESDSAGQGGLVPFAFNRAQRYIHSRVIRRARAGEALWFVIPKGRQEGVSTYAEGLLFYLAYSMDHTTAAVVAHDEDAVKNIFRKSKVYYDHLPENMRLATQHLSRSDLVYKEPHGSRIIVSVCASGATLGQSYTIQFLHVSEISVWGVRMREPELAWDALMGAIPKHRRTVLLAESSPQGRDALLYPLTISAMTEESDFEVLFLPWYIDATYQTSPPSDFERTTEETILCERVLKQEGPFAGFNISDAQLWWRRKKIASDYRGKLQAFNMYFPTFLADCFAATDKGYFSADTVEYYRKVTGDMPDSGGQETMVGEMFEDDDGIVRFRDREDGPVTMYERPKPDREYVLPADTSDGVPGGDWQYAVVIDKQTGDEVAHVKCRIPPGMYADILAMLGAYYNWASIAPERNRNPNVTYDLWHKHEYPNLHWMYNPEKPGVKKSIPGWHTNKRTRPLMLERFRMMAGDQLAGIRDPETPEEMESFVYNPHAKKYQAAPNRKDDRILTWSIGAMMLDLEPLKAKRKAAKKTENRVDAFRDKLKKMRQARRDSMPSAMIFGRSDQWPQT